MVMMVVVVVVMCMCVGFVCCEVIYICFSLSAYGGYSLLELVFIGGSMTREGSSEVCMYQAFSCKNPLSAAPELTQLHL